MEPPHNDCVSKDLDESNEGVTLLLLAHASFPSSHDLFILPITSFQWEKVCCRAVIFYIRVLNECVSFYSFLFRTMHTIWWRKERQSFILMRSQWLRLFKNCTARTMCPARMCSCIKSNQRKPVKAYVLQIIRDLTEHSGYCHDKTREGLKSVLQT